MDFTVKFRHHNATTGRNSHSMTFTLIFFSDYNNNTSSLWLSMNFTVQIKKAPSHLFSDVMKLTVLIHFGFCDVAGADHSLQRQPHTELETKREGCYLVGIVKLWRAVLEFLEGFLLRLRQRLHEVILIARY